MADRVQTQYVAVTVLIVAFVAMIGISLLLDDIRPTVPESYIDEDLSLQASRLKGISFGMEGALADWYWMRSLQYVGLKMVASDDERINVDDLRNLNPRLLYPLIDAATTLDPQFDEAYSYGAIVLPAVDPEQAIAIANKAINNNPNDWRYHQYLGFIYWKLEDYKKAAAVYSQGAKIEGAPVFLGLMAARMKNEGGSRETAREIYTQMLSSATDSNTRASIELRIKELDSIDQMELVQEVLDDQEKKLGVCPKSLKSVLPQISDRIRGSQIDIQVDSAGNILDPTGVPYLLDKTKCEIKLDPVNTQIPR